MRAQGTTRILVRTVAAFGGLGALLLAPSCGLDTGREPDDLNVVIGEITSGETYVIRAVHSGKCVDVSGVSKADGANVHQWRCTGRANQSWTFRSVPGGSWEISSVNSGKCLEVADASAADGGNVRQMACVGGGHQRWTLVDTTVAGQVQLRSVASGKCLDVAGVSSADGANVQQWGCGGGGNQRFTLNTLGGGSGTGGSGGGGGSGSGGAIGSGGTSGGSGGSAGGGCDAPGLVWKTGNKTNYTSYPEPGSQECVEFSGCLYEGLFAACNGKKPKSWVMSHNIVAAFPNFAGLKLHDLCLRSGNKTMVVTVLDTCGDADCNGCCTRNKGSADALIDLESFTNARWGLADGRLEWADLGPTKTAGCQ